MPKRTIKADFRWRYGYRHDHRCQECQHRVKCVANRTHYKCEKMGITASASTDIRLKDYACRLFEPEMERSEDKMKINASQAGYIGGWEIKADTRREEDECNN